MIFGRKIIKPMATEQAATTSTAAALTSLARRASSCFSGLAKSTVYSIAVLNNSATKTAEMVIKITHHSAVEICSSQLTMITNKPIKK